MMRSCSASISARVARNAFVLAGSRRSPDSSATAMRTRSFSVPLVPTASCGSRLRTSAHERFETGAHALVEPLAIGFRRRVVVHALRGQPPDAEREARRPPQSRRVADHDLDAAAADVDAERGRGFEHDARAHGREHEPRLFVAVDHLDLDAGLGLDAVDELAAVRRGADRARGLGDHLARAQRVGELAEAADRGDGAVGASRAGSDRDGRRRRRGAASPSPGRRR